MHNLDSCWTHDSYLKSRLHLWWGGVALHNCFLCTSCAHFEPGTLCSWSLMSFSSPDCIIATCCTWGYSWRPSGSFSRFRRQLWVHKYLKDCLSKNICLFHWEGMLQVPSFKLCHLMMTKEACPFYGCTCSMEWLPSLPPYNSCILLLSGKSIKICLFPQALVASLVGVIFW